MNQIETLQQLCALPGVTGFEHAAASTVAELLRPLVNKVDIDPFGTVTGILVSPNPGAKTVLLDAHLDADRLSRYRGAGRRLCPLCAGRRRRPAHAARLRSHHFNASAALRHHLLHAAPSDAGGRTGQSGSDS